MNKIEMETCPFCQRQTETVWSVRVWWSQAPEDALMCPGDVASLRTQGWRVVLRREAVAAA